MDIKEMYEIECKRDHTDMYYHLPKLREYAEKCEHITEMGVRDVLSTYALLMGKPKILKSYDIEATKKTHRIPKQDNFEYIIEDVLKIEIEETDFLFIDTLHTYKQLSQELKLHGNKAKEYLGFHDISSFGVTGEDGGPGLLKAISEFKKDNPWWVEDYVTYACNGLLILKRVKF